MCGVDCEQLRARLREAKRTRDAAHVSNAVAVGSGLDVPWSPADIRAFQHEVDVASGRRADHKRADTDLPNLKKAVKLTDYDQSVNDPADNNMMADSARQPQVLTNILKEHESVSKRKKIFDHRMSE